MHCKRDTACKRDAAIHCLLAWACFAYVEEQVAGAGLLGRSMALYSARKPCATALPHDLVPPCSPLIWAQQADLSAVLLSVPYLERQVKTKNEPQKQAGPLALLGSQAAIGKFLDGFVVHCISDGRKLQVSWHF